MRTRPHAEWKAEMPLQCACGDCDCGPDAGVLATREGSTTTTTTNRNDYEEARKASRSLSSTAALEHVF